MRPLFAAMLIASVGIAAAQPGSIEKKSAGPIAPDGKTEVQCDLPMSQRFKNIGSKIDGAGMCVSTSIEMAARWANLEQMRGFRDWCAAEDRGGAWPDKMDRQIKKYCGEKGIPIPPYVQYQGPDTSILVDALRSGRMAAVTYGTGHMVCTVNWTEGQGGWGVYLDNNHIGENELIWCAPDEAARIWKAGGNGWAFVWLAPGPPPVPRSLSRKLIY